MKEYKMFDGVRHMFFERNSWIEYVNDAIESGKKIYAGYDGQWNMWWARIDREGA